jgi:hypothetical protein
MASQIGANTGHKRIGQEVKKKVEVKDKDLKIIRAISMQRDMPTS